MPGLGRPISSNPFGTRALGSTRTLYPPLSQPSSAAAADPRAAGALVRPTAARRAAPAPCRPAALPPIGQPSLSPSQRHCFARVRRGPAPAAKSKPPPPRVCTQTASPIGPQPAGPPALTTCRMTWLRRSLSPWLCQVTHATDGGAWLRVWGPPRPCCPGASPLVASMPAHRDIDQKYTDNNAGEGAQRLGFHRPLVRGAPIAWRLTRFRFSQHCWRLALCSGSKQGLRSEPLPAMRT